MFTMVKCFNDFQIQWSSIVISATNCAYRTDG
ncbi:Uncharacterised protein [Vibrio cholerae]|nr:Uncharacterised protein [Vibrio cholerae]